MNMLEIFVLGVVIMVMLVALASILLDDDPHDI